MSGGIRSVPHGACVGVLALAVLTDVPAAWAVPISEPELAALEQKAAPAAGTIQVPLAYSGAVMRQPMLGYIWESDRVLSDLKANLPTRTATPTDVAPPGAATDTPASAKDMEIVVLNGHVHTTEMFNVDGVKYLMLGGGGAEQDPILPGRTSIKQPADYPPDLYWKGEPRKEEYNYVLVDVKPGQPTKFTLNRFRPGSAESFATVELFK